MQYIFQMQMKSNVQTGDIFYMYPKFTNSLRPNPKNANVFLSAQRVRWDVTATPPGRLGWGEGGGDHRHRAQLGVIIVVVSTFTIGSCHQTFIKLLTIKDNTKSKLSSVSAQYQWSTCDYPVEFKQQFV